MTPQEEKDYRDQLMDELPERKYRVESGLYILYVGKLAYIEHLVNTKNTKTK